MKVMHHTPIALAVAALFLSPMAFADQHHDRRDHNKEGVSISKDIDIKNDFGIVGKVKVDGTISVDSSAMAVIDDQQVNAGNTPAFGQENYGNGDLTTNTATATDNVLQGASGNVGLNISAGDSNQQANAAALAATDASFVFGSADSEVFAGQMAMGNVTPNVGKTNLATLNSNVLQGASGNIGVNVTAGNNNQQKNDLAASTAVTRMANANVTVRQTNAGNQTTNGAFDKVQWTTTAGGANIALNGTYSGGGSGGYYGSEGGVYGGTTSSNSTGTSVQSNAYYPEIWLTNGSGDPNHPCTNCSQVGHIDMDSQSQGAVGQGLAFNNTSSSTGTESGGYVGGQSGVLGFRESGDMALSGAATWWSVTAQKVWLPTTNTANLSGNVLQNASGNIGLNISAGTNNQQYNALAVSAAMAPRSGGTTGE